MVVVIIVKSKYKQPEAIYRRHELKTSQKTNTMTISSLLSSRFIFFLQL